MNNLKKIVWKLILGSRGKCLDYYLRLRQLQWLDKEQTLALQRKRLEHLLMHAYKHVPYYREVLCDAGVVGDSGVVNLKNFINISLLDKGTIRRHFDDLKSFDLAARRWRHNTSGGSTGEPVRLIQDEIYHDWNVATKMLHDLWSGYSSCERKTILWGSERDIFKGRETKRTSFGRKLRSEDWLNAFRMTSEQKWEYIRRINAFRPRQIRAYVDSIYQLARFVEREKLTVHSPESIISTAGTLHPDMRKTVESAFNTAIFNKYGSREVGDMACECEKHKGLHVSAHVHYIEILRPDGTKTAPGEMGEIVVTLLTNYAMPLIRYRIGDLAAWTDKPCPCGRGWPLLKEIKGRVTDIFSTKDGTQIHGEYFTHLFYFNDWVKKFQVIQEDFNHIRILVVARKRNRNPHLYYAPKMKDITKKVHLIMGKDCLVKYEFRDDIAPTDSGKYLYTISKVTA